MQLESTLLPSSRFMNPVTLIQFYEDRKQLGRRGFRLPLLISPAQVGSKVIDYVLDGRNNRVGKKVDGVLAQTLIYSNEGQIIFEIDNATQVSKAYAYATLNHVPDQMTINGTHYLIVTDAIGSVRMVLDRITGAIMQELDYDAFGNVVKDTNPGFQPFGFAGGLYDRDTGHVRFGARDYDPEVGRWTTKDPIRFGGGDTNLYGYVENDPVNWIDVGGLTKDKPGQVLENDPMKGGGGSCPISGYTRHGINSAISRADGGSMSPRVILNTVNSPTSVAPNPGGGVIYSGPGGQVILIPNGQVITVIPSGSGSFRGNGGTP